MSCRRTGYRATATSSSSLSRGGRTSGTAPSTTVRRCPACEAPHESRPTDFRGARLVWSAGRPAQWAALVEAGVSVGDEVLSPLVVGRIAVVAQVRMRSGGVPGRQPHPDAPASGNGTGRAALESDEDVAGL